MTDALAGFDWDDGNRKKCTYRGVGEQRLIRPISARFMHAKETQHYEAQSQDPSEAASPQDG